MRPRPRSVSPWLIWASFPLAVLASAILVSLAGDASPVEAMFRARSATDAARRPEVRHWAAQELRSAEASLRLGLSLYEIELGKLRFQRSYFATCAAFLDAERHAGEAMRETVRRRREVNGPARAGAGPSS